jgi:hypothetical protein
MVKYFKRSKQDGTIFYVNSQGHEIDEATAKRWSNLALKSEGTGARRRVIELSESTPPLIQQNELRARCARSRTKLEEAFRRSGMSDAEAKLAAKGRELGSGHF